MVVLNASVRYPGRRAIVVGGTSGIGQGIAMRLAKAALDVTIVGRSRERGHAVVDLLQQCSAHHSPSPSHDFVQCDVQLLGNVRDFANKLLSSSNPRLDVLVLTQGIATMAGRTETSEGLDQKMSIHYYSRMAFILHLLPLLRQSPSPRVLSVLSGGVHSPYEHYREDPELIERFSLANAANSCGFYNDLAMDALSQDPDNSNVAFIHSAPGIVKSNWGTEMPWIIRKMLVPMKKVLGRSIEDCGEYMSDALLREDVKPGFYLFDPNGKPAKMTTLHTPEAREFIWEHTLSVIKRIA